MRWAGAPWRSGGGRSRDPPRRCRFPRAQGFQAPLSRNQGGTGWPIWRQALALAIYEVGPCQIEQQGILAASLRAMARAVRDLALAPEMVLVDGHLPLPLTYPQQPVIKGDDRCPSIAAASVVAKVYRDRLMEALHRRYPQYNFARHKGYATAEHLEALRCWGPCVLHRRTFRGVKEWVGAGNEAILRGGPGEVNSPALPSNSPPNPL